MGAIAEAMIAYAQPLLEGTDGSTEQMNKALSLSSLCFNLAQMPEASRREALASMKSSVGLSDEEFADFHSSVIVPMIERYDLMFSKTAHTSL